MIKVANKSFKRGDIYKISGKLVLVVVDSESNRMFDGVYIKDSLDSSLRYRAWVNGDVLSTLFDASKHSPSIFYIHNIKHIQEFEIDLKKIIDSTN